MWKGTPRYVAVTRRHPNAPLVRLERQPPALAAAVGACSRAAAWKPALALLRYAQDGRGVESEGLMDGISAIIDVLATLDAITLGIILPGDWAGKAVKVCLKLR